MKGLYYALPLILALTSGPTGSAEPKSSVSEPTAQVAGTETGQTDGSVLPVVGQEGESAKVVVEAPTKGRIGELIRFDLTQSEADSIKWIVKPGSPDFEVYADGRRAVFSARAAGEYLFIIACAKDGTVDVVTHTVKIEGPPAKPDSQSLVEWLPYWLYPLQLDKGSALALADSFEDVAGRITALSTPKGIIEATAIANRAALSDSLETWKPILKKIQAVLANRAQAGTLATPEQHKETWLEIARGLRKYAS